MFKTFALFFITAMAEIVGYYLPYLWLKKDGSIWLWLVDAIRPTMWDMIGSAVVLLGMSIIMFSARHT